MKQLKESTLKQMGTLCAAIEVGDNGDTAKSAPVKLVARTSDPVWYPDLNDGDGGWLVHDFATMSFSGRVALDFRHNQNVGYLNRAEIVDNTLFVSGAIVPFGQNAAAELLHNLREGVPYEASIEGWSVGFDRYETGEQANVNGRTYNGFDPLFVQKNWELAATAITDRGRDGNTSVSLLSKNSGDDQKEIAVVITNKSNMGNKSMEDKEAVVVDPATEVAADQTATVEVTDETKADDQVKAKANDKAEAVEAEPVVVAEEVVEAAEVAVALSAPAVPEADARQHAKQFITLFGKTDGVTYFADGLSINDAYVKHIEVLNARIADLEKAVKSDRPAQTAVKFSASVEAPSPAPKTFNDLFTAKKGHK